MRIFSEPKFCPQMPPEFACKSADSGDELQMTFVQSLKMVSGMGLVVYTLHKMQGHCRPVAEVVLMPVSN